jgi:hypothetical protein
MKAPTISPSRIRLAISSWTCPRFGVGTILAFGAVDGIRFSQAGDRGDSKRDLASIKVHSVSLDSHRDCDHIP